VALEASLKRLRQKYGQTPPPDKPDTINERSWAIFSAYVYQHRDIHDIANEVGLSLSRVRQILHAIDKRCSPDGTPAPAAAILPVSPIEQLALSVRARNSLHKAGCETVQDVLHLDLSGSIRRMGPATRAEILAALQSSGFRHPSIDLPPSDMVTVAQSLERIQARIDGALRSVSKELSMVQDRLRKKMKYLPDQ
jgi:hypothetical protein